MSEASSLPEAVRLASWLEGPADAPIVILANPLGTTRAIWDAQARALSGRYRLLRFELRGHGEPGTRSDAPPGPYSIAELGTDVLALMDDCDQRHGPAALVHPGLHRAPARRGVLRHGHAARHRSGRLRGLRRGDRRDGPASRPRLDQGAHAGDRGGAGPGRAPGPGRGDRPGYPGFTADGHPGHIPPGPLPDTGLRPDLFGAAFTKQEDRSLISLLGVAACFSAHEDGTVDLPFDPATGVTRPAVWQRWLDWDPVRMVPAHADALRGLRAIWIDTGVRDEYHLDLGAGAFRAALSEIGVADDAVHFELFDAGHMGIDYRYPLSLAWLCDRMNPDH